MKGVESTYGAEEFRAHLHGVDLWRQTWHSRLTNFFGFVFVIATAVLVVLFAVGTLELPSQEKAEDWAGAIALGAVTITGIGGFLVWSHTKAQTVWTALEAPLAKFFFSSAEDSHFTEELGMMGRVK